MVKNRSLAALGIILAALLISALAQKSAPHLLNPEELKSASVDIFGRIYEYFLSQFASAEGHRRT